MYFRWSLVLLLAVLPAKLRAQGPQAPDDNTTPAASQASSQRPATVTCVSKSGRVQCAADTSRGVVLLRSTGDAPCLLGRTWGYDQSSVWVSDGCAAEFATGPATKSGSTEPKAPTYIPNAGFLLVDGSKGQIYFRLFSVRGGQNWYFLKDHGVRLNGELIYVDKSPVGYTAYPMPVGANGPVFHVNLEINF
jgi:hypothetical protein